MPLLYKIFTYYKIDRIGYILEMLTIYQAILILTVFVPVLTAIYVGRHRPKLGSFSTAILLVAMAVWDFEYTLSLGTEVLSKNIFWMNF